MSGTESRRKGADASRSRPVWPGLAALLSALMLVATAASAATVTAMEYYVDEDPGEGNATAIPAEDGDYDSSTETGEVSLDTTGLLPGPHLVYVRAQSSSGAWGTYPPMLLYVYQRPVLRAVECYIDDDPGEGNGTPLDAVDGHLGFVWERVWADIAAAGLSTGPHTLYVRAQNTALVWGPARRIPIEVRQPVDVEDAEFGFGSRTATEPTGTITAMEPVNYPFDAPTEDLIKAGVTAPAEEGRHRVFIRAMDSNGIWGEWAHAGFWVGDAPEGAHEGEGEIEGEGETEGEGEAPPEGEPAPEEGEPSAEGDVPPEGEPVVDGEPQPSGELPLEGDPGPEAEPLPSEGEGEGEGEGELPAEGEGEFVPEGETMPEGDPAVEGEFPADGELPAEGEPAPDGEPQPDGEIVPEGEPIPAEGEAEGEDEGEGVCTLLGEWLFDEETGATAYDSAGGNDGTLYDIMADTAWYKGYLSFGEAYRSRVDVPDAAYFSTFGSFSVEARIRWRGNHDNDDDCPVAKWGGGGHAETGWSFTTSQDSAEPHFQLRDTQDSDIHRAASDAALLTDEWHVLRGVFESGTAVFLYVDDELTGQAPVTQTSVRDTGNPLTIGNRNWFGSTWGPFNGDIDYVRIWSGTCAAPTANVSEGEGDGEAEGETGAQGETVVEGETVGGEVTMEGESGDGETVPPVTTEGEPEGEGEGETEGEPETGAKGCFKSLEDDGPTKEHAGDFLLLGLGLMGLAAARRRRGMP